MELKLQEMEIKELDKLEELVKRERVRRRKATIEQYFIEFNNLLERMKNDNVHLHYEVEYGFEPIEETFMWDDEIRVR